MTVRPICSYCVLSDFNFQCMKFFVSRSQNAIVTHWVHGRPGCGLTEVLKSNLATNLTRHLPVGSTLEVRVPLPPPNSNGLRHNFQRCLACSARRLYILFVPVTQHTKMTIAEFQQLFCTTPIQMSYEEAKNIS
jgi:hypothetical protein